MVMGGIRFEGVAVAYGRFGLASLLWRRICMNEGAMILRWRSGRAGGFDEDQAGVRI